MYGTHFVTSCEQNLILRSFFLGGGGGGGGEGGGGLFFFFFFFLGGGGVRLSSQGTILYVLIFIKIICMIYIFLFSSAKMLASSQDRLLQTSKLLVLDGGFATELERQGFVININVS